ncbi:hypothetical protein [Nostoc sp. LPT]|uniref:hypothetical protein n=1 Tax=Nostoc sp. LPT TaxID=2815387 RepID=UPI001D48D65F|nr:hypothetical protein [Nostoc sp. LPT]MBN4000564.1 hypothetical protein [Nostoc sp. LPT]
MSLEQAEVPWARMFGYFTELRRRVGGASRREAACRQTSLTSGMATFSMKFACYRQS